MYGEVTDAVYRHTDKFYKTLHSIAGME